MGLAKAHLSALALAAAAAATLSACGGGESAELLPGPRANQINANLEEVRQRAAEGDCVGAEDAVAAVRTEIADLSGVDGKLKANLGQGASRLEEVVLQCEDSEAEEPEPTVEPTVEPEEGETDKGPAKEKPGKGPKEAEDEPPEGPEPAAPGPALPPQANGKGEEKGKGGGPAPAQPEAEPAAPSGGVSPSVGVE